MNNEIKKSYNKNKEIWFKQMGFNDAGDTYIVSGETYSIKNDLKKAGFLYHPILGWHAPSIKEDYVDRLIKINYSEILEFSTWGAGWFFPDAKDYIKQKCAGTGSPSTSDWIGEINKPLPPTAVTLIRKSNYFGAYGSQNIYTFKDSHDNILVWFTTTTLKKEINDMFNIVAKIKAHNLYKDEKQTIITRVKIAEER